MQCNGVFNKRPRGTSLAFVVSIVLLCMCARIPCVVGQNKGFNSCLHVVSVFLSIHVQIYAFLRGSSLSVSPPLFALFYQCVSGACSSPPPIWLCKEFLAVLSLFAKYWSSLHACLGTAVNVCSQYLK